MLLACSLFAGCTPQTKKTIQDGIYTGQGQGYGGVVSVNVTVEDQKITDVEVTEQNETRTVSDAALKLIPEESYLHSLFPLMLPVGQHLHHMRSLKQSKMRYQKQIQIFRNGRKQNRFRFAIRKKRSVRMLRLSVVVLQG